MPATNFRLPDGSGNNLADPTMGQAGSSFGRMTQQVPFDPNLNHRMLSNVVVGQGDPEVANKKGLSELFTTWGQFVDHDLDLQRTGGADTSMLFPLGISFFPLVLRSRSAGLRWAPMDSRLTPWT